jgi:hypothetical protein
MSTRTDSDLRERPIGELLKQLAQETSTLVRQELDLAKAEMTQKGRRAGPGIGMVGGAGVAGLLTLGALTAFFILALDGAMQNWLAALIVALVYGAVAAVLYLKGKERVEDAGSPVPEQTMETLKEDVEWAKTQTGSGRR